MTPLHNVPLFKPSMPFIMQEYTRGQDSKIWVSPIVQNTPFWTIKSPFKAEYNIYFYTPSHIKANQPHRNVLILTKKTLQTFGKNQCGNDPHLCFKIYYELLIPDLFDVFLIFSLVSRLYLGILFKHHYGVYIYETGILCEIVIIKP